MLIKQPHRKKLWTPSIAPYYKAAGGGGGPTQVRVTFTAGGSGGMVVDHASIGIKAASGNVWDTAATPVELLFSGAHGFSVSTNASIVSDWANLAVSTSSGTVISRPVNASAAGGWGGYTTRSILGPVTGGASSLVVCMDHNAAADTLAGANGTGTDASYYFGPSAPNYNNATPSGGTTATVNCFSVTLIETQ